MEDLKGRKGEMLLMTENNIKGGGRSQATQSGKGIRGREGDACGRETRLSLLVWQMRSLRWLLFRWRGLSSFLWRVSLWVVEGLMMVAADVEEVQL